MSSTVINPDEWENDKDREPPMATEWDMQVNPPRVRTITLYEGTPTYSEWRTPSWEEVRQHELGRLSAVNAPVEKEDPSHVHVVELKAPEPLAAGGEGPPPGSFEGAFEEVVGRLRAVMMQRQRKYGKKNILKHGEHGVSMRFSDKEARIYNAYFDENKLPRPTPLDTMGDESLDDAWIDAANYAIIALMVRNGTFELPLKEDL